MCSLLVKVRAAPSFFGGYTVSMKKVVSILLIIAAIANIGLAAFMVISWRVFWMILIPIAALAYWVVPRIKDK